MKHTCHNVYEPQTSKQVEKRRKQKACWQWRHQHTQTCRLWRARRSPWIHCWGAYWFLSELALHRWYSPDSPPPHSPALVPAGPPLRRPQPEARSWTRPVKKEGGRPAVCLFSSTHLRWRSFSNPYSARRRLIDGQVQTTNRWLHESAQQPWSRRCFCSVLCRLTPAVRVFLCAQEMCCFHVHWEILCLWSGNRPVTPADAG